MNSVVVHKEELRCTVKDGRHEVQTEMLLEINNFFFKNAVYLFTALPDIILAKY